MNKINGIQSFEILQQTDGVATAGFEIEISDDGTELYQYLYIVKYRFAEEDSGAPVTPWTKAEHISGSKWKCRIDNIPTGGLYYLEQKLFFKEPRECIRDIDSGIRHIGVGDLFLIAGQSNAAGYGRGIQTEAAEIGISVLRKDNNWDLASNPLCDLHSPFMSFAKLMHKKLGYPIGLIPRAVGGVPISYWTDNGELLSLVKGEAPRFYKSIKAVLWYQGCSDAGDLRLDTYEQSFKSFAAEMRLLFNDKKLPIFTFQLNRVLACQNLEKDSIGYPVIREIQRQMPEKLDNVFVIPTIDAMRMSDVIHNGKGSNMMLGERLAYQALDELYHKLRAYKAPDIKEAVISGNELTITFDNVYDRLDDFGASPDKLPIYVEDDDGEVVYGSYENKSDRFILQLDRRVQGDVYVSCMRDLNPYYIIMEVESQLPVLCFNRVKAKR